MKFMIIFATTVALAIAGPHRSLVDPGAAGPAPAPKDEPIAIGPVFLDYEPIAIGPELVEQPIVPGPVPVIPEDIVPPVAPAPELPVIPAPAPVLPEDIVPPVAPAPTPVGSPLVQIILNINSPVSGPGVVVPQPPIEVAPADPVHVVDSAPEPVEIGPAIVPEPVEIGVPILPHPAVVLPEALN
ncbi:hypothetical protein PYW07_007491 [Mythimna separata]|uniref:Uncharacterized protein n=1 Tax=Mythimna separata TaxID=271217 RepID=A0AAD7Z392_MYTSE|nr:hypothetical protein PYW07_007491 [Mythimna separata]